MPVDLYEILGVSSSATPAELKNSYRRLALKYHPDQNQSDPEAEERFKELSHAYEILSDPAKRRAYDRLHAEGSGFSGPSFESFGELFDLLNDLIATGLGAGSGRSKKKGKDLRVKVEVTLEEVATGVRRDVTVPRSRECVRCGGSGAEPGTALATCPICDGNGEVQVQQGFFSLMRQCKECSGRGKLPEKRCRRCNGEGAIDGTEILPVDIPAGVPSGQTLRWTGKGATRRPGGEAGDLLIDVQVTKHRFFEREEADLHLRFPISYTQASLGASVEVPTLSGAVFMQVPPATQEGRVFRLRGKGLPQPGQEEKGDQYVRIEITSPEEIQRHRGRMREDEPVGPAKKIWKRVRRLFD